MDLLSLFLAIILVIIGIVLIIWVFKFFIMMIPAAIIAIIVYFLTFNFVWASVAFLLVAFLSILGRIGRRKK